MNKKELKEVRCPNCKKLLLKANVVGTLEVKCPRCGQVIEYRYEEKKK